jgi:hypothetical protein
MNDMPDWLYRLLLIDILVGVALFVVSLKLLRKWW